MLSYLQRLRAANSVRIQPYEHTREFRKVHNVHRERGTACRAPKPPVAPKTAQGNEGPQRQGSRFLRAFSSKQLKDTLPTVAPETAARIRDPPDAAKLDEGFTSPHQILDDER